MKVLVYGWYHQGNIGDDLFMDAFCYLFPNISFEFTEKITADKLKDIDAVFFGGGSFLLDAPNISSDALQIMATKKVFYLGVGIETNIHPTHQALLSHASLIATRSLEQVEKIKSFNHNVRFVPDLVYALQPKIKEATPIDKSVLVMTNISVVPHNADPHWKHAAWAYFKSEFGQFLDWLVDSGYKPQLFSMCQGINLDDSWASAELVNSLSKRSRNRLMMEKPTGIEQVSELISRHEMLITQRFHGIVLAEMTRTPYIAIHHHDKLKFSQPNEGTFLSYYNSSKLSYISAFEKTIKMNFSDTLPIESNIFKTLVEEVGSLL